MPIGINMRFGFLLHLLILGAALAKYQQTQHVQSVRVGSKIFKCAFKIFHTDTEVKTKKKNKRDKEVTKVTCTPNKPTKKGPVKITIETPDLQHVFQFELKINPEKIVDATVSKVELIPTTTTELLTTPSPTVHSTSTIIPSGPTTPPLVEEQLVTLSDYHQYDQLVEDMDTIVDNYPKIAAKYSIGQSVEGRDLVVMRLTSDASSGRPLLRPMVKFLANMHGNEAVGRELMLALIRYLTSNYGILPRVTSLLDTLDIHILPSVNPDGFEKKSRYNSNYVDLNRGFPDIKKAEWSRKDLLKGREPEVVATINWILDNPFVISINFHDGAVVANYPWDDDIPNRDGDSYTEDHSVFLELSKTYANNHKNMHTGRHCGDHFPGGMTNGADWYVVRGGMQDFNYFITNCLEITVELSCVKFPDKSRLQIEWENNKNSLLSYLETAKGGVRGLVTDGLGNAVVNAKVIVAGINKHVITSDRGEYWRLLTKGTYRLRAVSEDGTMQSTEEVLNVGEEDLGDKPVQLNFTLHPPIRGSSI